MPPAVLLMCFSLITLFNAIQSKSENKKEIWRLPLTITGALTNSTCEEEVFARNYEITNLLKNILNFKCATARVSRKVLSEMLEDFNIFELVQLKYKLADISHITVPVTFDAIQYVDFVAVNRVESITFIIKQRKKKLDWKTIFNSFSKQIWIALAFCVILFGLIFRIFLRHTEGNPWTLTSIYWYLLSTLLFQGVDTRNLNRSSSRITFGIWLLMVAVLLWGYAGVLTSFLAVQVDEPLPKTFDELAEAIKRKEFTCYIMEGYDIQRILRETKIKHSELFLEECTKYAKKYPEIVANVTLVEHIMKKFKSTKLLSAHHVEVDYVKMFTNMFKNDRVAIIASKRFEVAFSKAFESKYVTSEDILFTMNYGLPVRKGFPHKKKLDRTCRRLTESGIMRISDSQRITSDEVTKPLSMEHMYGAFAILLIGNSLAFGCFLAEVILGKLFKFRM
ncbi:glutamate [NMDA] receptor subunit 1-like [Centruroides sculpturatus]|uniref:glutamate [NMDA] receptor subunit 1-like n=1 Tax=Centruroides sculpturatus TaxID=218467 RepID=UPI000C6DE25F|nr:glutamate [NMDA] receptor subunit 1-like [Centruroides sculpturatus]